MPQVEYGHLFGRISNRAFRLFTMDLDILRNKYAKLRIDMPKAWVSRMKREVLVDILLIEEFGEDAIVAYKAQCKEWDMTRLEFESALRLNQVPR